MTRYLGIALALAGCSSPATGWSPAFDATATGWLLNSWGSSADDVYAVGGTPDAGVVMHFDGDAWTQVTLGLDVSLRTWTYGFSATDITVVGAGGTIVHYDGTSWQEQASGTTNKLWGVWGAAPDDLWAVGGDGQTSGNATVIHYDGTAWTAAALPALQRADVNAWYKVWGSAADDVYIVGERGDVLHYDGTSWTELQIRGVGDDLISVWGTDADHVVAVGGRNIGVVALWDGTAWTSQTYPSSAGFNGVWTRSGELAHVVGNQGQIATIDLPSLTETTETVDTDQCLHNVFGVDGQLFAVGGDLLTAIAPYIGVAYERPLGANE